MIRTSEGWELKFKQIGALWIHDEMPDRPHVILSAARHSTGYFNSERIQEDPALFTEVCADLLEMIHADAGGILDEMNVVAGPALGSITLAHELARGAGGIRNAQYRRAYAERMSKGTASAMEFKRTRINPGDRVLLIDDVITTGKRTALLAAAVQEAQGNPLPYIATILNRTGESVIDGRKVIALINRKLPRWKRDDCPLCKSGSVALLPNNRENWERLTF